jgi:sulfonate transport system ATP-binding protein
MEGGHFPERVWYDREFTAILATHDVSEAVTLASCVLAIENSGMAHDIDTTIVRPGLRTLRECHE